MLTLWVQINSAIIVYVSVARLQDILIAFVHQTIEYVLLCNVHGVPVHFSVSLTEPTEHHVLLRDHQQ